MGCNVSKDVKVEDQGAQGAPQENGIGNNQMSEDEAAQKIQAQFRGYKTRKSMKNSGSAEPMEQSNPDIPEIEKEEAPPSESQTNEEAEKAEEPTEEVAQETEVSKTEQEEEPQEEQKQELTNEVENEEEIDIDLDDPNVEKAAVKIQATFRGYKVRREIVDDGGEQEVDE